MLSHGTHGHRIAYLRNVARFLYGSLAAVDRRDQADKAHQDPECPAIRHMHLR